MAQRKELAPVAQRGRPIGLNHITLSNVGLRLVEDRHGTKFQNGWIADITSPVRGSEWREGDRSPSVAKSGWWRGKAKPSARSRRRTCSMSVTDGERTLSPGQEADILTAKSGPALDRK